MSKQVDRKLSPNKGETIFSRLRMARKTLSKAINNYQKVFGIQVDVYRIGKREQNKLIKVYGASNVSVKDPVDFHFLKTIRLLTSPTQFAAFIHQNADEVTVKLGTNELVVGDLIRIPWVDGLTLDYFVSEVPQTVANVVFTYKLVSQFNLDTLFVQKPGENNHE